MFDLGVDGGLLHGIHECNDWTVYDKADGTKLFAVWASDLSLSGEIESLGHARNAGGNGQRSGAELLARGFSQLENRFVALSGDREPTSAGALEGPVCWRSKNPPLR